jgi:hypothetical protein
MSQWINGSMDQWINGSILVAVAPGTDLIIPRFGTELTAVIIARP